MNYENIPKQLFDLIAEKKYENLSSDEKQMVENHLTQEEYNEIHNDIRDFRILDNQLKIVRPVLKSKSSKPSLLYRIINYKVPVYIVASCMALLFFVYFLFSESQDSNQQTPHKDSHHISKDGVPIHQDNYPGDLVFEL